MAGIGYLGTLKEINDVSVQEYHDQKNRHIMHQYNSALSSLANQPISPWLTIDFTRISGHNHIPPWEKQSELLLLTIEQGD